MRLFVVRSEYVVCRRARVTRRDTNKDKESGGSKCAPALEEGGEVR